MANKFAGELADAIVSAMEANKPAVIAAITGAEGGVEAAALNAIKNLPKPNGLLGLAFPAIESELTTFVTNYIQTNGADGVYAILDAEAHQLAKDLGG